jgi:hypothetical protein
MTLLHFGSARSRLRSLECAVQKYEGGVDDWRVGLADRLASARLRADAEGGGGPVDPDEALAMGRRARAALCRPHSREV